jgi:hypothetical protein
MMHALALALGAGGRAPAFNLYVDPVDGNDANPGTMALPKKTLGSVTWSQGTRVGLKRGTETREHVTMTGSNCVLGAYGTGAAPRILGSTLVVGTWTYAAGVGSIALAAAPSNVFVVASSVTKLTQNTATPTTPAANQWGHSAGTLYVNTGSDPNGQRIEHVTQDVTLRGVTLAADCVLEDVAVWFAKGTGAYIDSSGNRARISRCDLSWNCYDGAAGSSGANPPKDCIVESCFVWGNGYGPKDGSGADGDGVSFHGDAASDYGSATIRWNDIRYNTKSGIGNQSAVSCEAYGNYLEDNFDNIAIFPTSYGGATSLRQRFYYNIIRRSTNPERFGVYFSDSPAPYNHAVAVDLYNNVFYSGAANSGSTGLYIPNAPNLTLTMRNNIVKGFDRGLRNTVAGAVLDLDYNCVSGNTTNYYDNGTRVPALSTVAGAHSITSDPLFTNAGAGDFTLQGGSPCNDTGADVGLTQDYARNAVTPPVSIGAYA